MAELHLQRLLAPADPSPFICDNPDGGAAFLLTGDHAGNRVPPALGDLGLDAHLLGEHIAIDIGVRGLGARLSARLNAPFAHQRYSRLVIDCNRDPASEGAIPPVSDHIAVPGNAAPDRAARIAAIHAPYHAAIAAMLDARGARPTIFVALHSFTPVMDGFVRPWQVGVLHADGDARFAIALLEALAARGDLILGDNEPYRMDATDYSVPLHAWSRGLPYAEIEVRQDLLADAAGQARWAAILGDALETAAAQYCLR